MVATTMRRTTGSAAELSHTTWFIVGCPHPTMSRNQWALSCNETFPRELRAAFRCNHPPHCAGPREIPSPFYCHYSDSNSNKNCNFVMASYKYYLKLWSTLCKERLLQKRRSFRIQFIRHNISRRIKHSILSNPQSIGMLITMQSVLLRDMSTAFDQPGSTTMRKPMYAPPTRKQVVHFQCTILICRYIQIPITW